MKAKRRMCRRDGAALAIVLVLLVVLTTLGSGLLALSTVDAVETSKAIAVAEAFWTAEAGLEAAKALVRKNRMPLENIPQFGGSRLTGNCAGNRYVVLVGPAPGWNNTGNLIKRYTLTATGNAPSGPSGEQRQVALQAQIQTFAAYMHASNWEQTTGGSRIFFGDGDVIDGTVYVNDQLNISGYPQFLQRTYSAAAAVNYQSPSERSGVDTSVFTSGLTLGAVRLDFNDYADHVTYLQQKAQAGGLELPGSQRLEFRPDGTLVSEPRVGAGWGPPQTNRLSTINGAIYVAGSATVSGQINGRATVAANDAIYIEDDITYASAPARDHSDPGFDGTYVTDSLGLVAREKVEITKRSTINIHGAILVTQGDDGFGCAGRYEALGEPRINLWGSISQYRRGIVGQLGSGYWQWRRIGRRWVQVWVDVPANGFVKNYRYDWRFTDSPPVFFPYSAYEVSNWQQVM